MFGDNGRIISDLTRENVRLEQDNERLQRLQPGGLALAYGEAFDARVHDLVSRDFNPMDAETGIPAAGMDVIFDSAMRHAAVEVAPQAISELEADQQVSLVERWVPKEAMVEIALSGITRAITENPLLIKEFLDEEGIRTFAEQLVVTETMRALILDKLLAKEVKVQDVASLKAELKRYGHFSTDKLPEGAKVWFAIRDSYLPHVGDIEGRIIKTADGKHWIDVISDDRDDSANEVKPHTLIRLGYQNGEGVVVPHVIPGSFAGIIFRKLPDNVYGRTTGSLVAFHLDGKEVFKSLDRS